MTVAPDIADYMEAAGWAHDPLSGRYVDRAGNWVTLEQAADALKLARAGMGWFIGDEPANDDGAGDDAA